MVKFDEIAKSACVSQQTSAIGVANLLVLPLHSILISTPTPHPAKNSEKGARHCFYDRAPRSPVTYVTDLTDIGRYGRS